MTSARDRHAAGVVAQSDLLTELGAEVRILAHAALGLASNYEEQEDDGHRLQGRLLHIADKLQRAAGEMVPIPPEDGTLQSSAPTSGGDTGRASSPLWHAVSDMEPDVRDLPRLARLLHDYTGDAEPITSERHEAVGYLVHQFLCAASRNEERWETVWRAMGGET